MAKYRILDIARKVVGVGSVGTRCWVILLEGAGPADPFFLQVKEAQPSVLAPYFKAKSFKHEGQRVVEGQKLIQGAPDIFLGWTGTEGIQFYIRQLRDMKGSVEFDPDNWRPKGVAEYAMSAGGGWRLPTPSPATRR
jgi:uncharacterized protein (DUF2252 family)